MYELSVGFMTLGLFTNLACAADGGRFIRSPFARVFVASLGQLLVMVGLALVAVDVAVSSNVEESVPSILFWMAR